MRALVRLSEFLLVCAGLAYGGYRGYKHWNEVEAADRQELAKEKDYVYARIQESATGSHTLMVAIAREFTGEGKAELGPCDWSAAPKWGGSYSNPHWFGHTEGSSGMTVWCTAEIKGVSDYLPELQYQWDWEDGAGVTSFSWRYDPDWPDSGE
jgi:hypothetical protein